MEKITLSKVETFALVKAREQIAQTEATLNALIEDVATAHGIERPDKDNWQFSPDFSTLIKVAKPKEEKKPDA